MAPDTPLRALVVDDHPFHRKVAELLLRQFGITEIQTAASGFEAIAHLRAAPFGLVLCDIDMPGGNGPELISALVDGAVPHLAKQLPTWIWVSAMESDIVESHIGMALSAGLPRVTALRKPLTPETLGPALRAAAAATPRLLSWTAPDEEDIARVLRDIEKLEVYFQPQFELTTGKLAGAEALIRWHDPMLGTIPPDYFMPRVEAMNQADIVFFHTLNCGLTVCRQLRDNGIELSVSVNASAATLCEPGLFEKLDAMTGASGIPHQNLTIELTETVPVHDTCGLSIVLNRLRLAGYGVSIDDFGVGIATLKLLADLPFTQIKLDRAFTRELMSDSQRGIICRHVIAMARNLRLQCVAEGVETAEQLDALRALGCALGQGFLWAPALPRAEFLVLALRH